MKGSISLSTNFLVTLMLALLLFSIGFYFLKDIGGGADQLLTTLSESQKNLLRDQLLVGNDFVILKNARSVYASDEPVFYFAFRKPLVDGNLKLSVEKVSNGNGIVVLYDDNILSSDFDNGVYYGSIAFSNLKRGTHIFKVSVKNGNNVDDVIYEDYIRLVVK